MNRLGSSIRVSRRLQSSLINKRTCRSARARCPSHETMSAINASMILNPTTPVALLPPAVAELYDVHRFALVASAGMFAWELINDTANIYRLLTRYRFGISTLAYLTSRHASSIFIQNPVLTSRRSRISVMGALLGSVWINCQFFHCSIFQYLSPLTIETRHWCQELFYRDTGHKHLLCLRNSSLTLPLLPPCPSRLLRPSSCHRILRSPLARRLNHFFLCPSLYCKAEPTHL
jgi:hypothetical protein